jgi:hypothetical protein
VVQDQTPKTDAAQTSSTTNGQAGNESGKREDAERNERKSQAVKEEVKTEGPKYLKEDSYVYKEPNEKSQKTWLLKKGTQLTIMSPGPDGWHMVIDTEKRKGFVKENVLVNK